MWTNSFRFSNGNRRASASTHACRIAPLPESEYMSLLLSISSSVHHNPATPRSAPTPIFSVYNLNAWWIVCWLLEPLNPLHLHLQLHPPFSAILPNCPIGRQEIECQIPLPHLPAFVDNSRTIAPNTRRNAWPSRDHYRCWTTKRMVPLNSARQICAITISNDTLIVLGER